MMTSGRYRDQSDDVLASLVRLGDAVFSDSPVEAVAQLPSSLVREAVSACLASLEEEEDDVRSAAVSLLGEFVTACFDNVELTRQFEAVELANNIAAQVQGASVGDRTLNLNASVNFLQAALAAPELTNEQEAVLRTNMALALLDRRLSDDHAYALAELKRALHLRDRDRDPYGWGFTALNLGLGHTRQESPNHDAAIRAYNEASHAFRRADNGVMVAVAEYNMGTEKLARWRASGADVGDLTQLGEAAEHLEEALALQVAHGAKLEAAVTQKELAAVVFEAGDRRRALTLAEASLQQLSPDLRPGDCLTAADLAARVLVERGDWAQALPYYRKAVGSVTTLLQQSVNPEDRLAVTELAPLLPRDAAYCAAMCNRAFEAIDFLESLRAVELHAMLLWESVDLSRLSQVDPELLTRFMKLLAEGHALRREQWLAMGRGEPVDRQREVTHNRSVADLAARVRQLDGFEGFLDAPRAGDIARTVGNDWPVVYLLATARGACLLVMRDAEPMVAHFDGVDGGTLAEAMVGTPSRPGIIPVLSGAARDVSTALSLLDTQPFHRVAHAIAEATGDAEGITLVPLGLLPLVPWAWLINTATDRTELPVILTGLSGRSALHASQRAFGTVSQSSVATLVGDPRPLPQGYPSLEGSKAEVESLRDLLGQYPSRLLIGEDATVEALSHFLTSSSLAHLACHSSGRPFGESPLDWGLVLGGGKVMSIRHMLADGGFRNSLVVLSACQTASIELTSSDEVLGMPAAFLATGARGVLSTLWPVDDYATALLMTHFYESLIDSQGANPEAWPTRSMVEQLPRSQGWMRNLTRDQERAFVSRHASLHSYRTQHLGELDSLRGSELSYRDAKYWAGFVMIGG